MCSPPAITCGPSCGGSVLRSSRPCRSDAGGGVTTVDAMRRVVQANLSRGVDWIKVLATERAGTPDTDPRKQVYTEAELRATSRKPRRRGAGAGARARREGRARRGEGRRPQHRARTYLTDETLQLMKEGDVLRSHYGSGRGPGRARRRLRQPRLQLRGTTCFRGSKTRLRAAAAPHARSLRAARSLRSAR